MRSIRPTVLLAAAIALTHSYAAEPGGALTTLTFAPFDSLVKRCALTLKGAEGTYVLSPDYTFCANYNGISECVTIADTKSGAVRATCKIPHRLQGAGVVLDGFVETAAVYHMGRDATPEETFQCGNLLDQSGPIVLRDPAITPKANITVLYHAVTICIRAGKPEVDSYFGLQEKTFDGSSMRLVFSRFDAHGGLIGSTTHHPTQAAVDGILKPLFEDRNFFHPMVPIWQEAERGITAMPRTTAYAIYKADAPVCWSTLKEAGEVCEAVDHSNEFHVVLSKTPESKPLRYGAVMTDGTILGSFACDSTTAFSVVDMLAEKPILDASRTVVTALPASFHTSPTSAHRLIDAGNGIIIVMGTVLSEGISNDLVGYVDQSAPAPAPFVPLFAGGFGFVLNGGIIRASRLGNGAFNLHLGLGQAGNFVIPCSPSGVAASEPAEQKAP